MSKFKRTRDDITSNVTEVEAKIIHGADDVLETNTKPVQMEKTQAKLVTVPLTEEEYILLSKLSKIEDRSQRKISGRLLGNALQDLAKQKGILS